MRLADALTRISYELRAANVKDGVRLFLPKRDYQRLEYEMSQVQRMPQWDTLFCEIDVCGNIRAQPLYHVEELEHFYNNSKERERHIYQDGYNAALADMHEKVKG